MLKCDSEGIPEVVQTLEFDKTSISWVVTLFNSSKRRFNALLITPWIMSKAEPSYSDSRYAIQVIEDEVLSNPRKYLN